MSGFATDALTGLRELKATNLRVAEDLETLLGRLVDNPTEEEKAEIIALINENLTTLKGSDAKVPNPGDTTGEGGGSGTETNTETETEETV